VPYHQVEDLTNKIFVNDFTESFFEEVYSFCPWTQKARVEQALYFFLVEKVRSKERYLTLTKTKKGTLQSSLKEN